MSDTAPTHPELSVNGLPQMFTTLGDALHIPVRKLMLVLTEESR